MATPEQTNPATKRFLPANKMLGYDEENRQLRDTFLNVRAMAIDTDFYKGLRDRLFQIFQSGAITILYEMGIGYGELMAERIQKMGKNKLSVYRRFMEHGVYLGIGRFETPFLKMIISGLRGEPVVRLTDSFYAAAAGKTGRPECHIIRGTIAGAARILLNKEFDCVEEKCTSKSDPYCEFRLKEKSKKPENA